MTIIPIQVQTELGWGNIRILFVQVLLGDGWAIQREVGRRCTSKVSALPKGKT